MVSLRLHERWAWLCLGLLAGISIASIWPHEPVAASSADRNQKFAMITTPCGAGNEAVFVLDFLTGRLTGACVGRTKSGSTDFINFYARNVAEDFKVAGGNEPYYAISGGLAEIQGRGGAQWGGSAVYVAELNSGGVIAYAMPYRVSQTPLPAVPLVILGQFPFRAQNVQQ